MIEKLNLSYGRFCVLDDERKLILGIDFKNVFKKGHIYEFKEFLGEIIINDIGEFPKGNNLNRDINGILEEGMLPILTENELTKIRKQNR